MSNTGNNNGGIYEEKDVCSNRLAKNLGIESEDGKKLWNSDIYLGYEVYLNNRRLPPRWVWYVKLNIEFGSVLYYYSL